MSLHQIYVDQEREHSRDPTSKGSARLPPASKGSQRRENGVKTVDSSDATQRINQHVYLINPEQFKIEVGNQIIVTAPGSEQPLSEKTYHQMNNESNVVQDLIGEEQSLTPFLDSSSEYGAFTHQQLTQFQPLKETLGFGIDSKLGQHQWTVGCSKKIIGTKFQPFPARGNQHVPMQYYSRNATPKPNLNRIRLNLNTAEGDLRNHNQNQRLDLPVASNFDPDFLDSLVQKPQTNIMKHRRNTTLQPIQFQNEQVFENDPLAQPSYTNNAFSQNKRNSLLPPQNFKLTKQNQELKLKNKRASLGQGKPTTCFQIQKVSHQQEQGFQYLEQNLQQQQKHKVNLNVNLKERRFKRNKIQRRTENSRFEQLGSIDQKSNIDKMSQMLQGSSQLDIERPATSRISKEPEALAPVQVQDAGIKYVTNAATATPKANERSILAIKLKAVGKERKIETDRIETVEASTLRRSIGKKEKVDDHFASIQRMLNEQNQTGCRSQISELSRNPWGTSSEFRNSPLRQQSSGMNNMYENNSANQFHLFMPQELKIQVSPKCYFPVNQLQNSPPIHSVDQKVQDNLQSFQSKNFIKGGNAGFRQVINQYYIKNGFNKSSFGDTLYQSPRSLSKMERNFNEQTNDNAKFTNKFKFGVKNKGPQTAGNSEIDISSRMISLEQQSKQHDKPTVPWNQNNAFLKASGKLRRDSQTDVEDLEQNRYFVNGLNGGIQINGALIERVEEEEPSPGKKKEERNMIKTALRNTPNTGLNSGMMRSTNESKDTMIQLSHRDKDMQCQGLKIANLNKPLNIETSKSGDDKQLELLPEKILVPNVNVELITNDQKSGPSENSRQPSQLSEILFSSQHRMKSIEDQEIKTNKQSASKITINNKKVEQGSINLEEQSKQLAFGVLKPSTFPILDPDDINGKDSYRAHTSRPNNKRIAKTKGQIDDNNSQEYKGYIHQNVFLPKQRPIGGGKNPFANKQKSVDASSMSETEYLTSHLQNSFNKAIRQVEQLMQEAYMKDLQHSTQNRQNKFKQTDILKTLEIKKTETDGDFKTNGSRQDHRLESSRNNGGESSRLDQVKPSLDASQILQQVTKIKNINQQFQDDMDQKKIQIFKEMTQKEKKQELKIKQYNLPLGELPKDHQYIKALERLNTDFENARQESLLQSVQPINSWSLNITKLDNTSSPLAKGKQFETMKLVDRGNHRESDQSRLLMAEAFKNINTHINDCAKPPMISPILVGASDNIMASSNKQQPFGLDPQAKPTSQMNHSYKDGENSKSTIKTAIANQEFIEIQDQIDKYFENKYDLTNTELQLCKNEKSEFLKFLNRQQPLVSEMVEQLIVGQQVEYRKEYREKSRMSSNAAKRIMLPKDNNARDQIRGRTQHQPFRNAKFSPPEPLTPASPASKEQAQNIKTVNLELFTNEAIQDKQQYDQQKELKMYQIRKQKPDFTRAKTTFQVEPKELKLMKISKGVVEGIYGNDYKNQCSSNRKQQRSQSSSKSQSADEQADRYEAGDDKMQDLIMPKDSKVLSAGMAETENLNDGDGEIMSPGPNQWLLPDNRVLTPPSPSPINQSISNGSQRNRYKIQSSTIVDFKQNSAHDPSTQKTASQWKESSVTSTKLPKGNQSPKKASKEKPGSKRFDKKRLSSDLDHVMMADDANKSKDTPFKKKSLKLEKLNIHDRPTTSPKHVIPQKELQHVDSSSLSNDNKRNTATTTNQNVIIKPQIPKLELANIIGPISTQLKYNQVTVKFSNEASNRLNSPQHIIKVGQQVIESNRSKEESNFNLADFDKQISSRIASFKEAGDQATYRKHNGFQIGGIVGRHQNLQNQDMERKIISHQEKHRSLFEKLSKINNPQEVKASISGINSFIIKNNRNHVQPGLLQAKQRVYLEKGKLYNNQSLTGSSPTSKRSKSLAAGKDLVSVMGTAMQPSTRGPEMYKVIQAAEQFPAREIKLEMNKDLTNDLKRLEEESILYSKKNADQQSSTVRMASISSTTPRGRYPQPTSVIIDKPLDLQNAVDVTHGGTNTQSIDMAPAKTCTADQETSPLYSEKKAPSPKFSQQPEQVDTARMSGQKKESELTLLKDAGKAKTDELDDYGNVKVSQQVNNDSVNKLQHVTSNTDNVSATLPEMLTFQLNAPIKATLDKIVILDEQDKPTQSEKLIAGPSETECA